MGTLNLFPVRVPIGRTTDSSGKNCDVLMTPEFSRALSGLLDRVGGPDGVPTTDIEQVSVDAAMLQAFNTDFQIQAPSDLSIFGNDDKTAVIAALRNDLEQLRAEVAMLTQSANMSAQIDELRTLLAMQDSNREIIKGTATGSRAANAALASLLTALARSGLVIDNTTI